MKVKELIEKLRRFDIEKEILVSKGDGENDCDIDEVVWGFYISNKKKLINTVATVFIKTKPFKE